MTCKECEEQYLVRAYKFYTLFRCNALNEYLRTTSGKYEKEVHKRCPKKQKSTTNRK